MIVNKHSSSNVQRILAKKQNSFVLLSEQPYDLETEEYQQSNIYVVDDLDTLSFSTLRIIFETYKSGILVFVNTNYDKKVILTYILVFIHVWCILIMIFLLKSFIQIHQLL